MGRTFFLAQFAPALPQKHGEVAWPFKIAVTRQGEMFPFHDTTCPGDETLVSEAGRKAKKIPVDRAETILLDTDEKCPYTGDSYPTLCYANAHPEEQRNAVMAVVRAWRKGTPIDIAALRREKGSGNKPNPQPQPA